jgi:hypothetical protein
MRRRKGRLAKLLSVPVLAACGFVLAATMAGVGLAGEGTSTSTTPTTPPPTTPTTTTTTAPPAGKGCTPGFWKNNADKHGASAWTPPFDPTDTVGSVFSAPPEIASLTLLQGLELGGGGVNALTRHAIAAVLNAAHPDVGSPLTVEEIVAAVNAAFGGTEAEIEATKNMLEGLNEAGCPISQND